MRRTVLVAILAALCGGAVTWVVCCWDKPPGKPPVGAPGERAVLVVRPDPTAPKGQRTHRLVIVRVTGGPEGTIRYAPGAEWMEGGAEVERPPDDPHWTISLPPRSYILRPAE
jgi:hypothetical protein